MDPVALVNTDHGLVAIYAGDISGVAAWRRNPDGSWAEIALPLQAGDTVGGAAAIQGHPYIVVGRESRERVVTSSDLASWTEIGVPELSAIFGLAVAKGRAVLVGLLTDQNE